ncbi:Glutamate 5-kinase [Anaerovibrio sp. JC8]|uniref:glutamate 5-kinase n=1 Tax=Anaerovibrio sp. JC8 TaxID=1240085 RepID=UPI000A0B15AC|nr:glutamate 5-kinase [Anaerovibrio sp. JC8]ORT98995.1 Glutamate 5-kinase [Anaerovibrio sp. JC8]
MGTREHIKSASRIVVKVGTSTLLYDNGKLNLYRIEQLVRELADLSSQGKDVILVSSGAIGAGVVRMGLKQRPSGVKEKQALAAVGQGMLMHIYDKLFAEYGQVAGQVLLTRDNYVQHKQYNNSRNTLLTMLKMGVVPIINENDAVAVDEVKIGDNDNLSAMVAALVDADLLIILSDIDGVYTSNPAKDPNATLIHEIAEITPQIEQIAGGAGTSMGTGGMSTKIEAAKIATASGVTMCIASGSEKGIIRRIIDGEQVGTVFPPKEAHLKARKSWLAFGKRISGDLVVDAGCVTALKNGSSLLAAGIKHSEGEYTMGDTVRVLTEDYQEIARGVINFDKDELEKIKGLKTGEFKKLIPDTEHDEVIHRDNMVLMI